MKYKVGMKLKVCQRANPNKSRGPHLGADVEVVEVNPNDYHSDAIVTIIPGFGTWWFMDCKTDERHHNQNECFCMLEQLYNWRKL